MNSVIPVRVAVVGVGYFGAFHCSKLANLPGAKLVAAVDVNPDRRRELSERYGLEVFSSHRDLPGLVDAVIVAVPTSVHHPVAADLLTHNLHVLVEKPMTATVEQADELSRLASDRGLCLQVGFLERFNPTFQEALRRIHEPRFIHMERTGPFSGRGGDVNVVLDLMTHDLDILLQLVTNPSASVKGFGWPVQTGEPDVASARIEFDSGLQAEILSSRVSCERRRTFTVLDREGVLEVDLGGHRIQRTSPGDGKPVAENHLFEPGDPLLAQDRAFVEALQNGRRPRVGPEAGRTTVALASCILESLHSGRAVRFEP